MVHPSTIDVTRNWLDAQAHHDVDFQLADLDYRHMFLCGPRFNMTYLVGFRYGRLEQRFDSIFSGNGWEANDTEITFDGARIRLGLEAERHCCGTGWLVYGKSAASFLGGSFDARYRQVQSFDPDVVDTSWKAGRRSIGHHARARSGHRLEELQRLLPR